MLARYLFSILAFLAVSGLAAPVRQLEKRSLPRLGGVNLAGCDFGMSTDGTSGTNECPGTDQIAHFVDDGANVFRLPVGWQYLVGSTTDYSSTTLDATFFSTYDSLVQAVLDTGSYAMIDIHNYGRWNGEIIGQGGPSDDEFASLWSLLATQYANDDNVIFGIMNEPHDLDIDIWATTVQTAVNAIRSAGATTQAIAIPGTSYTGVDTWASGGSDAMLNVTDPSNSDNSLLIIDAHKYLDSDGSGTNTECTSNGVDSMTSFADWLSTNGRTAIISETGGGDTASCQTDLAEELEYVSSNTDVFVGFTIWAAGSFATDYTLSITPDGDTDNDLFVTAIEPYLPGSTGNSSSSDTTTSTSITASATTTAASISSAIGSSSASAATLSATSETNIEASSQTSSSSAISTTSSSMITASGSSSATLAATSTYTSAAPSSTSASATASASTSTDSSNLQTYTGALGNITAPAVTASGDSYICDGTTYNSLSAALEGSCYKQMDECQAAANAAGNEGDLTVADCEGEVQACLAVADSSA